jgi:CBS domain containing-hemolysin-like protein
MSDSAALLWFVLTIGSILALAFFSMTEMACVSFNKIRLQYYVGEGNKHAILLNNILKNPSLLFGSTLVGVNVALVFGSEFARQFYSSIGISPDLAPLTQVAMVVIFGELAPMFAARRYNEHVALLGIPLLSAWAKLMTPVLWIISGITSIVDKLLGTSHKHDANFFISREELQKIIEGEEDVIPSGNREFNTLVTNIFNVRPKTANSVMSPIDQIAMIPSNCTIGELRQFLFKKARPFVPVYHKTLHNIIGIAFPRDLLREPDNHKVRDSIRQPWFITQSTPILTILKQFRRNNQTVAVVLNEKGNAVGILTLEDIIDEIFGNVNLGYDSSFTLKSENLLLIEKTFPGSLKIADFNRMYHVNLEGQGTETLAELMTKVLGHQPEEGETAYIPPFELTVKETTLLEIKSVTIKTRVQ